VLWATQRMLCVNRTRPHRLRSHAERESSGENA
jgi:hypothetical protein